mgnify:CR=1 FL=1
MPIARWCSPLAASLVALTLAAALAACGNDGDSSDTSNPTSTARAKPAAEIPETPVGEQLHWVLDHLAPGGQPPTVDEIDDEKVERVIEQLREQNASLVPVEGRGAQEGDYAVLDLFWKPQEGGKGGRDENALIEVGSKDNHADFNATLC